MSINAGMFNFQDVMNKFYSYTPDKNDAAGNAMKNSFAANMVQSGWDSTMAKDMASHQTGLSHGTMTHAADLELRNTTALMQQEHGYNMQSMGAQYGYQNQFADNQVGRDVTTIGATAEQTRATDSNKISAQGQQNAMERVVQGEQDRLTDTNKVSSQGKETRATDSNRIQQEGEQNRAGYETQGKVNQALERTRQYEQRETDSSRIRTEGQETRETARTTGDENRKGYVTQGEQERETATHAQKLKSENRNQEGKIANTMARSF